MKELTLFNARIKVLHDGMVSLTDMWKASGKADGNSPYHYLRNKKTIEYMSELDKNHESVVFKSKGVNGGTFAGKYLAYDYASWLSPSFKYGAYKVLDGYFNGELISTASVMAELNMLDHVINEEKRMVSTCASIMNRWGLGGRKQQLNKQREKLAEQSQINLLM